ncbi:hypothetical protein [Streptomyces broussonetiae]|uniref:Uncharacterized protein n=1 Tax=Streptomyces broussonetiae TaxID=2686304 RepID=A0ABV5E5L3_9ACTN
MTDRKTGPACGNNPNYRLTDGDRKAVEDFQAYLGALATIRDRIAEALIRWAYRGQDPDPETGILPTVRANAHSRADAVMAVLRGLTLRELEQLYRPHTTPSRPEPRSTPAERAALERVRDVLDTEAVAGRSAIEYRGLILSALMADEPPLSPYYSHEVCGFHWHGRDGMDIPMRDGQPVCPRCELAKAETKLAALQRRRDEVGVECKRRGKRVLEQSEQIRALKREIDGIQRQLGAEILRANQAEAEAERLRRMADKQPDTPAPTGWEGATELASDREITARAATGLVGYRQGRGTLLHCLAHKPAPASRWADFHEVRPDDLDNGGICVHPRCGRDLLAPWPVAGSGQDGVQQ